MAKLNNALVAGYVQAWLEQLSDQITLSAETQADMKAQTIPLTDLIDVLEASDDASSTKENPHDAFFSITGTTVDGERLRVTLSIDPLVGICVHGVQRL
ncbi:protein of unknown function [uncultured Sphingopyxis sp.]|uniref:Uncharacterized protein n=1 Tax=uncultured Sphingopyxis sp. TaxID=310581 RepID=A0A1Y5PW09_9SPHN|nr:hypothetical protein [uncultured Sphingopyxis sp.]SBV34203.1 protein of unknown function [uncultured Sphingopyxis sp.]